MQRRTFIRTMLDIFLKNPLFQAVMSIVKFCNEQRFFYHHELKFLKNLPINKITKEEYYQNRLLFTNAVNERYKI